MPAYTPERWAVLSDLLADALPLEAEARSAFLDEACAGDAALREEIGTLIAAYERAEDTGRFSRGALDLVPMAFPENEPPESIGPYELLREIGRGGMGTVWLARRADGVFEQHVAVKMMQAGFLPDEYRQRFAVERRILGRLHHPNIARILDGGVVEGGRLYLVMEYVDGLPVTDYCRLHRLGVDERLALFSTICDAVAFAHQNLVIHRDLKPSNIMVTTDGRVKLLDFGIAKLIAGEEQEEEAPLTRTGMALMTPEYAAPEQVMGQAVTTASDVYALGVVLFELLTGERPYSFPSRTPSAIEQVVCRSEPTRPSTAARGTAGHTGLKILPERLARRLRGDLDTIILKALRKEPEARYATAERLGADLRRHMRGLPVAARPVSGAYRLRKFVGRHRVGAVAAVLVAASLLIGFIGAVAQARIAGKERRKAAAVSAFLQEMLASPDPFADGPDVRVADVLDRAGRSLAERFGGDPALEMALQRTIGVSYMELGLFDKAEPHLRRSLALLPVRPDPDEAMETWVALGSLRRRMGEYESADSFLTMALAAGGGGKTTLVRAERLSDLGALRWEQGDYAAAEPLLTEALQILTEHPDMDSMALAVALGHMATLRSDQGQTEEAEALYRRSLAILRSKHGDDHPDVPLTISHLAIIRDDLEDFEAARELHEEALRLYRRLRGPTHPDVAYAMGNLAAVEINLEHFARAESLQMAAIAIDSVALGADHPTIGIIYNNIGSLRRKTGDVEGALAAYRKAVAIWRAGLPPDHPYLGYGLQNEGAVLMALGRTREALPPLREAYELRAALLPEDNPERANTAGLYGEALARIGRRGQADSLLTASYERILTALGPEHTMTQHAKERLEAFGSE